MHVVLITIFLLYPFLYHLVDMVVHVLGTRVRSVALSFHYGLHDLVWWIDAAASAVISVSDYSCVAVYDQVRLVTLILAHLACVVGGTLTDRRRDEGIAARRRPVAEASETVAVLWDGLLVAPGVELRVVRHAHVGNALLSCVHMSVQGPAVLVEVGSHLGPVLLGYHGACHARVYGMVA